MVTDNLASAGVVTLANHMGKIVVYISLTKIVDYKFARFATKMDTFFALPCL